MTTVGLINRFILLVVSCVVLYGCHVVSQKDKAMVDSGNDSQFIDQSLRKYGSVIPNFDTGLGLDDLKKIYKVTIS